MVIENRLIGELANGDTFVFADSKESDVWQKLDGTKPIGMVAVSRLRDGRLDYCSPMAIVRITPGKFVPIAN